MLVGEPNHIEVTDEIISAVPAAVHITSERAGREWIKEELEKHDDRGVRVPSK